MPHGWAETLEVSNINKYHCVSRVSKTTVTTQFNSIQLIQFQFKSINSVCKKHWHCLKTLHKVKRMNLPRASTEATAAHRLKQGNFLCLELSEILKPVLYDN